MLGRVADMFVQRRASSSELHASPTRVQGDATAILPRQRGQSIMGSSTMNRLMMHVRDGRIRTIH